jgi:uncharacterized membrane-anchored protein YhcB (DUF1043 family)
MEEVVKVKHKRTTAELLREIAEDYQHLSQDTDGKIDGLRKKRYRWLVKLSVTLSKKGNSTRP